MTLTDLERAPLSITVATSNPGKLDRAREAAHKKGLDLLRVTTPLFDEEAIKQEMTHLLDNGISYTVGISQAKLAKQRQATLEAEGRQQDYMLVVSDSVIIDNRNSLLNRDNETHERETEVLAGINQERQLTFAGAVSFGRKNGYGNLTVVSYCSIPLAHELAELPRNINALPEIQDAERPIEVGYIVFGGEGGIHQTKKPVAHTVSFDEARPYISGLTPEVLEMIHETGQFEAEIGPVLEDVISQSPFNTAGFYHALEQHGGTPEEFYATFTGGWRNHLQRYGGNCSLLSLEAGRRAEQQGKQADILLYPQNGKPEGHSSLILTDTNGRKYFADPGFTMPYVIPVNAHIPLAPARISGAKSMTVVENGNNLPIVHVLERDGGIHRLVSNGRYQLDDFEKILPQVLGRLHQRETIKLDYHTKAGRRTLGFTTSRDRKQVSIRSNNKDIGTFSLDNFSYDTDPHLVETVNMLALRHNLDPYQIISQLDTLRRHV